MEEKPDSYSMPIISVRYASAWLADKAPIRDAKQWELWLRNNRMPNRPVAYRVPYAKGAKKVFYRMSDLERIARIETNSQHSLDDIQWMESHK